MTAEPCVNCREAEGKYKCPKCSQRTCSAACSKQHKETHPVEQPSAATISDRSDKEISVAQDASSSTLNQKANELADMPEYKMLMKRYPNLLSQLSGIAAATDPPSLGGGGSDAGAGGSQQRYTGRKQEPWTPDIGIQKGMEVLKTARQARGADSEGIKEFIELHRMWTARQLAEREADSTLRKQKAEADAKAIKDLLQKEKAGAK